MKHLKKLIIIFTILILGGTMLFNYFLKQMKNPTGIAGNFLFSVWNATFKDMANWGLSQIPLDSYSNILDIGIGGGETLHHIATTTHSNNLFGIDISEDSITFSEKRNSEFLDNGRMQLFASDVAELPFNNEQFDLILAFQTHIYWDNMEQSFEQIYRVLETDGTLVIVCEKDKIDYHIPEFKNPTVFQEFLTTKSFKNIEYKENNNWVYFKATK